MYKIIGADGKEYGPITAETVRRWIAEGRLNASSRVQAEGTPDWKSLSEFPEFADAFTAKTVPPPPTASSDPLLGQKEADSLAAGIIARDYQLDIGSCLSRGWNLVMSNFWITIGATAVTYLLLLAVSSIPGASLLITFVLAGGLDLFFLKIVRGQRAEFGDIFAGFSALFVPLMVFSIIGQLFAMLGFLLCIIPGIYAVVVWLMFPPLLIIDKRFDFWPAMELSRKVVTHQFWSFLGFNIILFLIIMVGLAACCIGVLLALPVVTAAAVYAYEDIFGRHSETQTPVAQLEPIPPPA